MLPTSSRSNAGPSRHGLRLPERLLRPIKASRWGVRFSKTIRTSIRNPLADETVTEVADDPCRAYLIANNIRSSGIRVGEQAHYPAVPSTSQILKADFALAQRVYQLAQEPRLYWVSLSTVSSSRAVEGVSQDESRLPPPTQPARPPPGYPHRFLKRQKNKVVVPPDNQLARTPRSSPQPNISFYP